jgi:hypothetical protein
MSDELLNKDLLKNEELDVEAHRRAASDEPKTEDKDEDEVEAHVRKSSPRHI